MAWLPKRRSSSAALAIAASIVVAALVVPMGTARSSDHLEGHFRTEVPGQLTPDEARQVYGELASVMASGYRRATYTEIRDYQTWRRYNTAPYLSAIHSNRYVNNYANHRAEGYERMGQGKVMPEGAILAKDSFVVTDSDDVRPATLFVMEKLAVGASPESADWRYLMVLPDGTVFGDSRGAGNERTAFCHECHTAVADADYLYLVPEEYRAGE